MKTLTTPLALAVWALVCSLYAADPTPTPISNELKNLPEYQKLEKQIRSSDLKIAVPKADFDFFNAIPPTTKQPPLSEQEKLLLEQKADREKNWLSNALADKKSREQKSTKEGGAATQRETALKALSGQTSSDLTALTSPDNRLTQPAAQPTNPFSGLASLADNLTSLGSSKFTPAISGLSSGEKVEGSPTETKSTWGKIKPIEPISSIETPKFTPISFDPIAPIPGNSFSTTSPLGVPATSARNGNISLSPSSISPVDTRINLPTGNSISPRPIALPKPATQPNSTIYKPKVADPNDFLRR